MVKHESAIISLTINYVKFSFKKLLHIKDLTKCYLSHVEGPMIICPLLKGQMPLKGIQGFKFKACEAP